MGDSSEKLEISTARPRGLVPGSIEWLREVEGPKLVKRLVDEAHANPVGEMTPTQARCAALIIERVLPSVSAVHHTVESSLKNQSDAELKDRFERLMEKHTMQIQLDSRSAVTVDFSESIDPVLIEGK